MKPEKATLDLVCASAEIVSACAHQDTISLSNDSANGARHENLFDLLCFGAYRY